MDIKVDMNISQKCMDTINKFYKENGNFPKEIYLNSEQYRDLWLETFYTWTRELNKPHILENYGGCKIKIHFDEVIICK
ncbi:hypothetical protein JJB71_13510 [Clostridium perfringens]|uniref:hypothetical protein n=1 Tax=Clostridium perfringens TaxID=1502 RepID=UPI001ABB33A0|nr:hypothetical protein [Clostridium perfringens]MBO3398556.1 hypothetical protein [Clostridium perfringens]